MDKTKLLAFCVIGLILLNLGVLGFMFAHKPDRRPHVRKRDVVIEKLHFDKNQILQYDELIALHRQQIGQLEIKTHEIKNKLYLQLLRNTPDNKLKNSLMGMLSKYHTQIEQTHFKHFEGIRQLCHKEQMNDFYALTEELSRLFSQPLPPER